jgi:hypothetical protein
MEKGELFLKNFAAAGWWPWEAQLLDGSGSQGDWQFNR